MGSLDGPDGEWKTVAQERMARAMDQLKENEERFFLKTRMSVPFARRSETAARALGAALKALDPSDPEDGLAAVGAALDALEKALRTLDERSQMKGMAIT
jgi:hypothetical protein